MNLATFDPALVRAAEQHSVLLTHFVAEVGILIVCAMFAGWMACDWARETRALERWLRGEQEEGR